MTALTFWLSEEVVDKHRRKRLCLGCGQSQEYETKKGVPSYVAWYKAHLPCRELCSGANTNVITDKFKDAIAYSTSPECVAAHLQGDRVEVVYDEKPFPGTYEQLYSIPGGVSGRLCPVRLDGDACITYHDPANVRKLSLAHYPDPLPECPQCAFVGVSLRPTGLCPDCDDKKLAEAVAEQDEEALPTRDDPLPVWMLSAEEYSSHRKNANGLWLNEDGSINFAGNHEWKTHRIALLDALSHGILVPEKAVASHNEPYLTGRWEHVRDVLAGVPAAWGGHWEAVVPVGTDGEMARVISYADDLELRSDKGVISETGYHHFGQPLSGHKSIPPLEYAQQLASHFYAVIRLPKSKQEKAQFRPVYIPAPCPVAETNTTGNGDVPENPRIAAYIERTGCTRAEFDELQAAGVITPRALAGVTPLNPNGDPCSFTTNPGPLAVKMEPIPNTKIETQRSRRAKSAKSLREEAIRA